MELSEKSSSVSSPPPYSLHASEPPKNTTADVRVVTAVPVAQPGIGVVIPMAVGPPLGPKPAHIVCPSCRAEIVTKVERQATTKTHLFATLLCFIGGILCVWIPYCTDSCQNADHYCPNCNAYIGSYRS